MLPQYAHLRSQPRPLSGTDLLCFLVTAIIAYVLSPPWVIALFRVLCAPLWLMNSIAFFYAPLTFARENLSAIDAFYHGYRVLLGPWLSGI